MAFRLATVTAILLVSVLCAEAQQAVRLEFNDGKVNLAAKDAPIRAILTEWARLGGVIVVNGDGVVGPPVTLELASVPERQALDILLRGVSGYMIAPRRAGSTGVSMFDRILILPTSAPPITPPPANAARPAPRRPPIFGRPPQPESPPAEPDDVVAEQPEVQEAESNQPPRPADPRLRPPIIPNPNLNTSDPDDQEQADDDVPAVPTTPGNPFGIPAGSSATPGVVTPAPQQRPGPARVQ